MMQGDEPELSPQGEAEWERLRAQLELSTGFWLGFVFSPSAADVEVLRRRAVEVLKAEGRELLRITPSSPDELRGLLDRLFDPDVESAGCTWIEALHGDPPRGPEAPWQDAWDHVFLRLNERRDALRRRLSGGLVFAAPREIKPRVRDAAPDLWSVRALVVELLPRLQRMRSRPRRRIPVAPADSPVPDPRFALIIARRLSVSADGESRPASDLPRALALLDAGEGFMAQGRPNDAKGPVTQALALLRGRGDVLAETRALALVADVEYALDNAQDAEKSILEALEKRRRVAPDEVPLRWYDLAGVLALQRRDFASAHGVLSEALEALLRGPRDDREPHAREIAHVRRRQGEVWLEEGDAARAQRELLESVSIWRRLLAMSPESIEIAKELGSTLELLGDAQRMSGELSQATAAFAEAKAIGRRS